MAAHQSNSNKPFVLVLTPHQRYPDSSEDVVRIERVPKSRLDKSRCQYQANGPYTGLVVNKGSQDLPKVKPPELEIDFTAFLLKDNIRNGTAKQEQRFLRFWFAPGAPSKAKQMEHAQLYFKRLIKPERFPTDYVGFIKKAVLLTRHFPAITRVEIVLKPLSLSSSSEDSPSSEDEEDDVLTQARLRRDRANQRMRKWAKLDNQLQEEDDLDSSRDSLDNYITLHTHAKYEYTFLPYIQVNTRPFFTFRVKAKCDVHVALSTLYGETELSTYEIVIGTCNNTKSIIRDGSGGKILEEAMTPKILNGLMFRSFWIKWGRRFMEVGLGHKAGQKIFLRCFIHHKTQYHINSLAVTTGPGSKGQWEIIEKQVLQTDEEREEKRLFHDKIRLWLMWEAKRRRVLELLGDAYSSRINTANLRRLTKTKAEDVMKLVTILKDLARCGDVIEVQKGVWIMAHCSLHLRGSAFEMVDLWPRINHRDTPSMMIVTTRACEKLAVDASLDSQMTYARCGEKGAISALTIGRIDSRVAVHVNLSQPFNPLSKECLTDILGHFPDIQRAFLVGVGGAVPHFSDHEKHVRLGDVVVSLASRERRPVYVLCDKVGPIKFGRYQFGIDVCWMTDELLKGHVIKAKDMGEARTSGFRSGFERQLDRGIRALKDTRFDFRRPPLKTDKLFGFLDGEYVPIEHPQPPMWREGSSSSNPRTNFRFGPVGSGKTVARNEIMRMDFSQQYELAAFDAGSKDVLEILQKSGISNYLVIRGMADYVDGSINKRWQPHAAMCAASFLKTFLSVLPKERF